ncbi:MAG TPA: hypothetical protein VGE30_04020 [Candidatus Saccharimonadales bacterium]
MALHEARIVPGTVTPDEADFLRRGELDSPEAKAIFKRIGATPVKGEVALTVGPDATGYVSANLINLDPADPATVIRPNGRVAEEFGLPTASEALAERGAVDATRIEQAIATGNTAEIWGPGPGGAGSR